jgi:hypothetical protein
MPWALLLDLRVWLAGLAIGAGIYAAVQRMEKERCQATFAQFRADVESEAAKAKVAAARREALQATNAQEALDDLQARNAALSARYERLRHAKPGSGPVPSLSDAAKGACPERGEPGEPDPLIGLLDQVEERVIAVLAKGDDEIAKYVELYRLEQANAAIRASQ